ncbi:MAG: DUF6799 domain-containing protein [Janthinobacterium lividum]
MKLLAHTLLLSGALLAARAGYAQTTAITAGTTSAASGTAAPASVAPAATPARPGTHPLLAPRRVVAPPRRGSVAPVRAKTSGVMAKDGVTFTEGRVLYTELGLTAPITENKKFINGTTVSPTGLLTSASGTTTQLAEGDYASMTGRITTKHEMIEADSVRKLEDYDRKHPGKRKELEKAREKAEKEKEKADKEKAKLEAKGKK